MAYCFRLRVQMATPVAVGDGPRLLHLPQFPTVEVSLQGDAPLLGKWVVFKSCAFSNEDDALEAGRRLCKSLWIAGAVGRLGVDIGLNHSTLQFSRTLQDALERSSGRKVTPDIHGLMICEKGTRIVTMNATGSTVIGTEGLREHLVPWLIRPTRLTERQRNCVALLNDSFFAINVGGQFVLRVSAVEALCEHSVIDADCQGVIQRLLCHLTTLNASEATTATIRRMLDSTNWFAQRI